MSGLKNSLGAIIWSSENTLCWSKSLKFYSLSVINYSLQFTKCSQIYYLSPHILPSASKNLCFLLALAPFEKTHGDEWQVHVSVHSIDKMGATLWPKLCDF